jgi:hypothetical protein
LPQVNLIPPEVGQRRAKSRRRTVVVLLFVTFILFLALGYVGVAYLSLQAQAEAEAEAQRTAELQAEIASLSEVDLVKAQLANSEAARQYAASVELFWPVMLAAIDGALPEDARVQNMDFATTPFGGSPPLASDALGFPGVATVTLTIDIPNMTRAAEIEDSLNAVPFFTRARTTQGASSGTTVEGATADISSASTYLVDITFTVTYDALMMRYSPRWYGDDDFSPSLEEYYADYLAALLAGAPLTEYPPLPEVTPPPFVPGSGGAPPAPEPSPAPSPSPGSEVAS